MRQHNEVSPPNFECNVSKTLMHMQSDIDAHNKSMMHQENLTIVSPRSPLEISSCLLQLRSRPLPPRPWHLRSRRVCRLRTGFCRRNERWRTQPRSIRPTFRLHRASLGCGLVLCSRRCRRRWRQWRSRGRRPRCGRRRGRWPQGRCPRRRQEDGHRGQQHGRWRRLHRRMRTQQQTRTWPQGLRTMGLCKETLPNRQQ